METSHGSSDFTRLLEVPVERCVFLRRLNRFVSNVLLGNLPTEAHTNNTGRLLDLLVEGREVLCTPISGKRLRWRIVGTAVEGSPLYTLIDTSLQERAVLEAIGRGLIPSLKDYGVVRRNVRVGGSTFDLLLKGPEGEVPAEIKSAVFYFPEDGTARYPDTVTLRGRRHVEELGRRRGILIFVAAHPLARAFRPCSLDPELPRLLSGFGGRIVAVKMALTGRGEVLLMDGDLPLAVG